MKIYNNINNLNFFAKKNVLKMTTKQKEYTFAKPPVQLESAAAQEVLQIIRAGSKGKLSPWRGPGQNPGVSLTGLMLLRSVPWVLRPWAAPAARARAGAFHCR